MKNKIYFKNANHFVNFCKKKGNFTEEETTELLRVYNLLNSYEEFIFIKVINKISALLTFDKSGEMKIKDLCRISKQLNDESIVEIIRKCSLFKEEMDEAIKFFYSKEDFQLSEEILALFDELTYKKGLYFLYDQDKKLIYIGKSINLGARLITSIKDRKPYYAKYKLTKSMSDANILELFYIAKYKPILNKDCKEMDEVNFDIKYSFLEESDYFTVRRNLVGKE